MIYMKFFTFIFKNSEMKKAKLTMGLL